MKDICNEYPKEVLLNIFLCILVLVQVSINGRKQIQEAI